MMDLGEMFAESGFVKTPQDYLASLRRRRWLLVSVAATLLAVSVVVALFIPPVYRSTATILIEEPEVPSDLVQSTVTSYADQRIQLIKYRVTTTQNLSDIMKRFDLYRDLRKETPMTEIIERFREDIKVETINAQVLNPRSGRPTRATIAFTVSYDSPVPQLAQKVANELVTLYLSENARERQGQAAATTQFLKQEANRLAAAIKEFEAALAKFKQNNAGRLPQQLQTNVDIIDRNERHLSDINRRMEVLKERQLYIKSELTMMAAKLAEGRGFAAGQSAASLRSQINRLQSTHGPNHPTLVRLREELAALQNGSNDRARPELFAARLDQTHGEMAGTAGAGPAVTLGMTAPPEDAAAPRQRESAEQGPGEMSLNPTYIQLRTQLNAVNAELAALDSQRRALHERIKAFEQRVLETPEVERRYLALIRDYDNSKKKYDETKNKQLAAELSQSLETEHKSERFVLIEPPQLPSEPAKPSKLLIVGIGLLIAVAGGIGAVFLADAFDDRIHEPRHLAALTGEMPMVIVPFIRTPTEEKRVTITRSAAAACVALVVIGGLATAHYLVMPLDVLWLKFIAGSRHIVDLPHMSTVSAAVPEFSIG